MRSVTLGSMASVLVFMLAFGALITGCGGNGDEGAENAPAAATQPAEETANNEQTTTSTEGMPENVVVRVSGEQGAIYGGTVGSVRGETRIVEGRFGPEPDEYEINGLAPGFDAVQASIVNPAPYTGGTFKVQIVADGEVVAERATSVQYSAVNLSWSYQPE